MRSYLTVIVERDPMEKIPVTVLAHEGPILGMVHDIDSPQIIQRFEVDGEDFDPAEEYNRLVEKYGHHPDTKQPYATMAYGQLAEGRFAKALAAAHSKSAKSSKAARHSASEDNSESYSE